MSSRKSRVTGFYSRGKGANRKVVPIFGRGMFRMKGIRGMNPESLEMADSPVDYALLEEKSATYEALLDGVKRNLFKYLTKNIGSLSLSAFEAGLSAAGPLLAAQTDMEALTTELAALVRDAQSNEEKFKKELTMVQSISSMTVVELKKLYSQLKALAYETGNNEQVVLMLREAGGLLGKTSALQKEISEEAKAGEMVADASSATSNEEWHEAQIAFDKEEEPKPVAIPNEKWHEAQIRFDQKNELS